MTDPELKGLKSLPLAERRILLEGLEVEADIGFHAHEIGTPQRLVITIEIWVEAEPDADEEDAAWNYDFVRETVVRLVGARRYNLQETLVRSIYDNIASVEGVVALKVKSMKPDIYDDAAGVGVEYASAPPAGRHQ